MLSEKEIVDAVKELPEEEKNLCLKNWQRSFTSM